MDGDYDRFVRTKLLGRAALLVMKSLSGISQMPLPGFSAPRNGEDRLGSTAVHLTWGTLPAGYFLPQYCFGAVAESDSKTGNPLMPPGVLSDLKVREAVASRHRQGNPPD